MKKVKSCVLDGYGLNCGYETKYSLELAGARPERVHINDLIKKEKKLEDYHIFCLIGGFSWGDDHGAGVLEAQKLKNNLDEDIQKFIKDKKLIIGICNGFQALVNYGLLPGFDGNYNSREVALIANDCGNFRNQWVHLKVEKDSPCVFTKNMWKIDLPIRHGEGKFYAEKPVIKKLFENNQVVLRYVDEKTNLAYEKFPHNPNGSLEDIAGICDTTGTILGMMPHPEAYNNYTNHPRWTIDKELNKYAEVHVPVEGEGIQIFRNAVEYVKENF